MFGLHEGFGMNMGASRAYVVARLHNSMLCISMRSMITIPKKRTKDKLLTYISTPAVSRTQTSLMPSPLSAIRSSKPPLQRAVTVHSLANENAAAEAVQKK